MNDPWTLVQGLARLPVSEQTLGRLVRELAAASVAGAKEVAATPQPVSAATIVTQTSLGDASVSVTGKAPACSGEPADNTPPPSRAQALFSQSRTEAGESRLYAQPAREEALRERTAPGQGSGHAAKGTYLVVHLPQGRTSVYLPQQLMQRLCEHKGSAQAAREHVRQLARRAPADITSRSGWIHQQLLRELAS